MRWTLALLAATFTFGSGPALGQMKVEYVRNHGGAQAEEARDVDELPNGDIVVAGWTASFGAGDTDLYLTRWTDDGSLLWSRTYGGGDVDGYEWVAVQVTHDEGFILCGESDSSPALQWDFFVVRTDGEGNVLWQHMYGGAAEERPRDLRQTQDGGFIIGGFTRSYGQGAASYFVVKVDSMGVVQWQRSYGGPAIDDLLSLEVLKDGGYVIAGYTTNPASGPTDIYVLRLDDTGNVLWDRRYGGNGTEAFRGLVRVRELREGGFGLASYTTNPSNGEKDAYFVTIDASGQPLTTHYYGGIGNDDARDFVPSPLGGFVLFGHTYSYGAGGDFFLVGTDHSGRQLWRMNYGGTGAQIGYGIEPTHDGGFVCVGSTTVGNNTNILIVKLRPILTVQPGGPIGGIGLLERPGEFAVGEAYPNPFNAIANFELQIPEAGNLSINVYNLLGQSAYALTKPVPAGDFTFTLDAQLATGVHWVQFTFQDQSILKKVLYLK